MKCVIKKGDKYWPSPEMKKIALVSNNIYKKANKNPIKFWEKLAKEGIYWEKLWKKTYEEKIPYFKWFKNGKLNFCYNCLDRHIENGKENKTALIWIPEQVNEKPVKITYQELYEKVCKFANVLKKHGVKKRDIVVIYLPLIPEALIAMLACTRIGAVHSVVFSAFAADALKTRIKDGKSKLLITADGYYRRGEEENLLEKARKAIKGTTIKKVLVVPRLKKKVIENRKFRDFNEELKRVNLNCKQVIANSEDILFLLYTSGTTGKSQGIIMHDTGGYAVQAYWTTKWNFNLHEDDIVWCTADIGWITGHTYAFYGPLLNGSTTLIYEGSLDFPKPDRWWEIIESNNVTVLYTAPTAIRMFMKFGDKYVNKHKLKSLKILGTVGEPIDKNTWLWYFKKIGKTRCPIIDTWWQTETGGTLINALPGIGPFVPMFAGRSFPGTEHLVVDDKGREVKNRKTGFLVQKSPFAPGMLHGFYKNHKGYIKTYWRYWMKYKKPYYDTSDGAFIKNNLIRITGRIDDVMKVAGHRLSTAELESAINEHKSVNECAVVSVPDKIKGEVPVAFAVLRKKINFETSSLEQQIKKHVDNKIGPIARPSRVYFVNDLPKTRSGKIVRHMLKEILANEKIENMSILTNPECVSQIKRVIRKN